MKNRILAVFLVIALSLGAVGCSFFGGAEGSGADDSQSGMQSQFGENGGGSVEPGSSVDGGKNADVFEFDADELGYSEAGSDITAVEFSGMTAKVSGSGAVFSDGTLLIDRAGTYVLSGALDNGQVLISAERDDIIRLVLDGVSIHNETGPAIYATRSEKVVLILEPGKHNSVSDGPVYAALASGDDPSAAIYTQHDLSITGNGSLSVTGNHRHGIRTQDTLTITGGSISVISAGDALRGRDGVAIQDGSFTFVAGGDGIQSNNPNGDDVGFVVITGGTFDIQAQNDGVQAESFLTITGGTFDITTGGGSANAPERADDPWGGGMGWGGRPDVRSQNPGPAEDTDSMKGLKARTQLTITGGDFTIDAEDDGVHSDGNILISGGKLNIKTGDDGIHADYAVEITGGVIEIPICYEGIEGLTVTISGGDIFISASDDGINASDSEADSSFRGWGGYTVSDDMFVRITGGTVHIVGGRDGIDSNSNIFLEGGTLMISGPSSGMEGAIDLDGSMLITGGSFITAGSIMNVSQNSTQPVIGVSYTRAYDSGSVISIKDSAGNTLLEYKSEVAFYMSGFTSPEFKIGETYTLFIDGVKLVDITLGSMITAQSDDGGAYGSNSGGGGQGGQGGPGRGRR